MNISSLQFLPQFILSNPDIKELLDAEQVEIDRLSDCIELLRSQTIISTASIYLSRYEAMFGFETNSKSDSDSVRIRRILAKLNTQTNATLATMRKIISTITYSKDIQINEYFAQYIFTIDIIRNKDDLMSVNNIADITDLVETIKPAHLGYIIHLIRSDNPTTNIGVGTLVSSIFEFQEVN